MDIKKTKLVYFSATGTTASVLDGIAAGIGLPVTAVDFTSPDARLAAMPTFAADEVVVLGAPVYFGRVLTIAADYFKKLKAAGNPCVVVGVYGNRHYDDAIVEMEDIATDAGFAVIGGAAFVAAHSFTDAIATGRPNEDDIAKAKTFGESVKAKLEAGAGALAKGTIKGNRPYKDGGAMPPVAPVVSEACIDCKACADACPVGAINHDNVAIIDGAKCIKCRACARICPVSAIDFAPDVWSPIIARVTAAFGANKCVPEYFM